MNWNWSLRSRDGGMNGLEFARCTTASGFARALVHAAPTQLLVEIRGDDDSLVARSDLDRVGEYSPMTLLELHNDGIRRSEIWPDSNLYGVLVLLAGGEVGVLSAWRHADDHSWWQWSVEFANHTGRPGDWAAPGQVIRN